MAYDTASKTLTNKRARENDGNGLYYYWAGNYSPQLVGESTAMFNFGVVMHPSWTSPALPIPMPAAF
jgi:hypothetical protein